MFGMSMTEIIIIVVIALIVLGPKDLPKAAQTLGKAIREVRKAGDDLRDTFEREVMQEPTKPVAPPPGVVATNEEEAPVDEQAANAPPAELPAPEGTVSKSSVKESA